MKMFVAELSQLIIFTGKKPPKVCDPMCKAVIKAKNVACEKLFI